MSRAGKYPLSTKGAQITVADRKITVKGPKGELSFEVPSVVEFKHANDELVFTPKNSENKTRAQWGTARRVVGNMVKGVTEGFVVNLEMFGTGYRANIQGQVLSLSLGYSHEIKFGLPKTITAKCPTQTEIEISGADKQLVGQIAAEIRSYRKPEPYKGKGVKRKGEYVRRKEGKKK